MGKNEQKNFGQVGGRLAASRSLIQGLVSTARRGGLPFAPAKGSKTGQRGTKLSPLQTPLTLSYAGYECCFSLNNREKQIRTAHRCAPKVATAYLPPPPCGTRKELRAARLLVLFDRCGCSASLHPPLAALGFAPPFPSPVAGEGPSGQIAAYSGLRLGSVTFCASLLGKSQSLPPCGARKNLCAARLLDFFDRCGCSASLHPPLAVLSSASPSTATPSPPKFA